MSSVQRIFSHLGFNTFFILFPGLLALHSNCYIVLCSICRFFLSLNKIFLVSFNPVIKASSHFRTVFNIDVTVFHLFNSQGKIVA